MATRSVGLCLLVVLLCSSAALAQTQPTDPSQRQTHGQPAYTGAVNLSDVRPVTNWFLDSTISDGIDAEPYFQLFDDNRNGIATGLRIAAWSFESLELGGQLGYVNIDGGESGMSDLLTYARYQIDLGQDMPEFALGGTVDIPTGKEEVGEGTVDFRFYGAGRYDVNQDLMIFGNLGFESLEMPFIDDRENGLMLGAGLMVPLTNDLVTIGEFNLGNNDFAAVTGALDYELPPGGHLRAGLALGLDSGAPDVLATFALNIPLY